MKILVATVQVPFVRGGAEILAENLLYALRAEGHQAEIVAIPFKWYPPERILECMLACRLLDLSESCGDRIDRVIGLKFPAYLIAHPHKVIWLLHQHRQAYDLWGTPFSDLINFPNGLQIRESIISADNKTLLENIPKYTISKNVSSRLKTFNQANSTPLYHPPQNADLFYCEEPQNYFFFPSRLNPAKRQELVIEALAKTKNPVKLLLAGTADQKAYKDKLLNLAKNLRVGDRVKFLGSISEEEKIKYYAQALAVVYPPFDEDYGYVTLEGMLASKPVITCTDAGGPTEFIQNRETGLVVQPNPITLASAMDELWENVSQAKKIGKAAKNYYKSLNISWSNVVTKLLK